MVSIDTSFDNRTDAGGRDPDRYSPTLRKHHQLLWSKPLPSGSLFELVDTYPLGYLRHTSSLGDFKLSSDMIFRTFRKVRRAQTLIQQVSPELLDSFAACGSTVAGTILFPANKHEGAHTLNQARGISRAIEDRFDLTLECVRRHYVGQESPLSATIERYASFFRLFEDFSGYVGHFLLDDLVDSRSGRVRFFDSWSEFGDPAIPQDLDAYVRYARNHIAFLSARRARIEAWAIRNSSV